MAERAGSDPGRGWNGPAARGAPRGAPIRISVFDNLLGSIAEQMGETLRRCAVSPNIRDRLDFSAALFDARGQLVAQAAHIPVHLGSMAFALHSVLALCDPRPGEMVLLNDPYRGGTHLPDLTLVAPVDVAGRRIGYAVNRAHHADVGGERGASMAPARRLSQEGVVIAPVVAVRGERLVARALRPLLRVARAPAERRADLWAQVAANRVGTRELAALASRIGLDTLDARISELLDFSEASVRSLAREIPGVPVTFTDYLDGDGIGPGAVPIRATIVREGQGVVIDFAGSAPCVEGNVNAVLPVTVACVFYVLGCLLGEDVPSNAGCLRPLDIRAPAGTVVNACPPHAVAAGNVETSQRIVDVLLGALARVFPGRIPAASCGSMNNLSLAGDAFAYYETLAGGMGAGPATDGLDAVHTHMTNTRNTPVEMLEMAYPVRVLGYAIRRGSGGAGRFRGGDGVIRALEALAPMTCALLGERRTRSPWGLAGGGRGRRGVDLVRSRGRRHGPGRWRRVAGKTVLTLGPGDCLRIETPGGGGHGRPRS